MRQLPVFNDLREIVEKAKKNLEFYGKKTILFLDEIHRFNKLQQDGTSFIL